MSLPNLDGVDLQAVISQLDRRSLSYLSWQERWTSTARPNQLPPDGDWTEMGYMAGRGFGKGLALHTPIRTPSGWTTMGDLVAGSVIYDETGATCRVVKAHEPYTPASLYRVAFSDGSHLIADGEHQWVTWTHAERKRFLRTHRTCSFPRDWASYEQPVFDSWGNVRGWSGPAVRTTDDLLATLTHGTRGDRNHCIPTCGDLSGMPQDLRIPPWILGYWLGNGGTNSGVIACHQQDAAEVAGAFSGYLPQFYGNGRDFGTRGLAPQLRSLGVLGNKHVPEAYLLASAPERRALLAGLLDSDGHCSKAAGVIEFCSTTRALADAVVYLARSLGQKPVLSEDRARLNGRDCGPRYRVTWRSTYQPFHLPRKAAAWRPPAAQGLRNAHRMVVSITPVPIETVRCITVDSPNSLYLAGEALIPTHNTRVGAEWLGRVAWEDKQALPKAVVAPTQNDVRFTCFEGQSGLLSVIPPECIDTYSSSDLLLTLTNGTPIRGFSAEKAERLRGPEHSHAWCFIAGTMVSTPSGQRSIESLVPGDVVLTRRGARRVLANASREQDVGEVAFSTGAKLVGTTDHPVYTPQGWVDLGCLSVESVVCATRACAAGCASDHAPETFAASVVSTWRPMGQQRVYCLRVEGEPEYFANGILVHNCDEIAAWGRDAEYTLDMLQMGLRIGDHPQLLWTSTPRPNAITRLLTAPRPGRIIIRGSTYDNKANLSRVFIDKIKVYEGTKIGRQEIDGELLDPEEAGIVRRSQFNLWPHGKPLPKFEIIIMSLDTAFTERTIDRKNGDPDPTACSVWGMFRIKQRTHVMLLDCWEDHLGLPDLVRRVKREMACAYGDDQDTALIKPLFGPGKPLTSGKRPDILLIEDKGSGISLRQTLYESGIEAYAYNPGSADKLARLHIVSPVFAQRRVWVPESGKLPGKPVTWAEPLIGQLCAFAGTGSIKHDDHVDSTTQALRLLMDKGMLSLVREQPAVPQPDREKGNPYAQ